MDMTRRTFAQLGTAAAVATIARNVGPGSAQADAPQLEFLMNLTIEAQRPRDTGRHLVVPVSTGAFEGPRLKGTVVGPSGDWIVQRPDGSRLLDVRAMLLTEDDQAIALSWRGIAYTNAAGELVARIQPLFETASPAYSWLNNVVSVGVYTGGGHGIAYRIYRVP